MSEWLYKSFPCHGGISVSRITPHISTSGSVVQPAKIDTWYYQGAFFSPMFAFHKRPRNTSWFQFDVLVFFFPDHDRTTFNIILLTYPALLFMFLCLMPDFGALTYVNENTINRARLIPQERIHGI